MDAASPFTGCNPLPADTPDLSNSIVLVRRTQSCSYYTVQANLEPFNATAILLQNNDNRPFAPVNNNQYKSVLAVVDSPSGTAILATLRAGGNVTAAGRSHPNCSYRAGRGHRRQHANDGAGSGAPR